MDIPACSKIGKNLDFGTAAAKLGEDHRKRSARTMQSEPFTTAPFVVGSTTPPQANGDIPIEEALCPIVSHEWVNSEYKHMVVEASPKALAVRPGQFFNLLCPSPDVGELWLRRPQSVYRIDRPRGRIEFLYKTAGRGTRGLATLKHGDDLNMVGPLGVGFSLKPEWKNIVVLGRGVGLATMGPISQLAGDNGVRVTAILRKLIAQKRADAFYTCGSNRLMELMKKLGKEHGIPGQVAMEQIMACGLGPCYVCVRTFELNGKKELRRVCIDGPVFDLQEALGW